MTEKPKLIKFLDEHEDNARFNADFARSSEQFESEQRETLKFLILDYLNLTPMRSYSMAVAVLDIGCLEIQKSRMLSDVQKKDGTSRNDAEAINRIINGIKLAKEQIGIDPKSIASKGDGSMNEAFADVVKKGKFDKRRFICKPVFGVNSRSVEGGSDACADEFKGMDDDKVTHYLETAASN